MASLAARPVFLAGSVLLEPIEAETNFMSGGSEKPAIPGRKAPVHNQKSSETLRKERLAVALRENLKRRKGQQKLRANAPRQEAGSDEADQE